MLLGREVLDQQVLDADGRHMGKVDGIVLAWNAGGPARVSGLVIGGTTLLWRLHPRLAAWAEGRWGPEGHVTLVPWRRVLRIGIDVKVDIASEPSPALHWEHWVRDRILRWIPGA